MAAEVATLQHEWVKHTITRVHVVAVKDDGEPVIVVDPDDQADSEVESTAYGCVRCSVPMAGNIGSPCEPEFDD